METPLDRVREHLITHAAYRVAAQGITAAEALDRLAYDTENPCQLEQYEYVKAELYCRRLDRLCREIEARAATYKAERETQG